MVRRGMNRPRRAPSAIGIGREERQCRNRTKVAGRRARAATSIADRADVQSAGRGIARAVVREADRRSRGSRPDAGDLRSPPGRGQETTPQQGTAGPQQGTAGPQQSTAGCLLFGTVTSPSSRAERQSRRIHARPGWRTRASCGPRDTVRSPAYRSAGPRR